MSSVEYGLALLVHFAAEVAAGSLEIEEYSPKTAPSLQSHSRCQYQPLFWSLFLVDHVLVLVVACRCFGLRSSKLHFCGIPRLKHVQL